MQADAFFVEIAKRPPFTRLHPKVGAFFKAYFAHEKVVRFGDQIVREHAFSTLPGQGIRQSRRRVSSSW